MDAPKSARVFGDVSLRRERSATGHAISITNDRPPEVELGNPAPGFSRPATLPIASTGHQGVLEERPISSYRYQPRSNLGTDVHSGTVSAA